MTNTPEELTIDRGVDPVEHLRWIAAGNYREGNFNQDDAKAILARIESQHMPRIPDDVREREAIEAAIRTTEYKYFGDYELSADQSEAVEQLVLTARRYLTLLHQPEQGREGWLPIESAPHNKSVLLAWQDWRDGAWIMDVGPASTGERTDVASSISHHGSATHWRPLPAAPVDGEMG